MCGFSMGGVHACMVAALCPRPVACVPLLAPRSAAVAFCHGALRDATAWQPLAAAADEAHMASLTSLAIDGAVVPGIGTQMMGSR